LGLLCSIPDCEERFSADGEQCKLKPGGGPSDQIQAKEEEKQTSKKEQVE
jgi:hypothetical protein